MAYRDSDGLLRGRRGGISSNNSSGRWAAYYEKHGCSSSGIQDFKSSPPDVRDDVNEVIAYAYEKEQEARNKYFSDRGYDPDDPDSLIDMELDAECNGPD